MKKVNLSTPIIVIFLLFLCNSICEGFNVEAEIHRASQTFVADMNTRFSRLGFESIHLRYNKFKIEHIKKKYENPESYKKEFNSFFRNGFRNWLMDSNLIGNVREHYRRFFLTHEIITSFQYNASEYIQFLKELKEQDALFNSMADEEILKIQIYSNFIIISGGINYFKTAEKKTFIWPFCKKE